MDCEITPEGTPLTPLEPHRLRYRVINTSDETRCLYLGHWPGKPVTHPDIVPDGIALRPEVSYVALAPGDRHEEVREHSLPLVEFLGQTGHQSISIDLSHRIYTASADPDRADYTTVTRKVTLSVDLTGVDWLMTHYRRPAQFFSYGGGVYACGSNKGHELLAGLQPGAVKALTRKLLLGGGKLHLLSHSSRRAPKGQLTGLSDVFFRSETEIFTNYGPAKVEDPASFQPVDPGHTSLHGSGGADGDRCGYGRDASAGYFFCESTSGKHAVKLRGCRSPQTLEALGQSYARDEDKVYLEGRSIKGADPASFTRIGTYHARDRSGIWYLDERIEGADPDTFELLDDSWSRDKTQEYDGWLPEPHGSHAAACRADIEG